MKEKQLVANLILLLLIGSVSSIKFPASFAVVRNLLMPLNIDTFYAKTGCCKNDSNGNSAAYNIISLDGFKSAATLATLQQSPSPLGLWLNAFASIAGLKPGRGGNTTATLQSYILKNYHEFGAKLIFNAFADECPVSLTKSDPLATAQSIVEVVKASQLDGVSLQFNDFHAVAAGSASAWLLQLLTLLKRQLDKQIVVLVLPVSFVSRVDILQQPVVSAMVDLFVLKYFGYNQQDYTDYNTIFNKSANYPQTAFAQLLKSNNVGINLCRALIAKPAAPSIDGFVTSTLLASAFMTARNNFGWFGGYANLDLEADLQLTFQKEVLQQLRSDCSLQGNCFCL